MDEWDEAAKALFRQYWDSDRVLVGRAEERKAFLPIIATALRQAAAKGRAEMRERAADLMEMFTDRILHFRDRPGGPPGNYWAHTTNSDRAAAIRALPTEDEPTS